MTIRELFDLEKFCKEVREGKWDAQRDAVVRRILRGQTTMRYDDLENMSTRPEEDDDDT